MSNNHQSTAMARATAIARDTGWDLDGFRADHGWKYVGVGPVGQHRDSGTLERSNFEVISGDLCERFGDAVETVNFGHWGVGWIEEITFDAGRADVCDAVEQWEVALADYPVADDMHHSTLEHDEMVEWCDTLRLEHDGEDGLEYIVNPLAEEDFAGRIASMLFDRFSATRPDDAPGEDDIRDAAVEAALLIPSSDSIARELEEARETLERTRDAIADVGRGLATLDEVERIASPFVA